MNFYNFRKLTSGSVSALRHMRSSVHRKKIAVKASVHRKKKAVEVSCRY